MLVRLNKPLAEAAVKYFLAQAVASTLLISGVALNTLFSQKLILESFELLVLLALLIKAGIPPLHL